MGYPSSFELAGCGGTWVDDLWNIERGEQINARVNRVLPEP